MSKNIVITGSTRGIGLGMALEFLKRGHQVCINGTSHKSVSNALKKLQKYEAQLCSYAGSVTELSTHLHLFDVCKKTFGSVDVWINNAGISQANKLATALDPEEIELIYDINIKGMTMGSLAALQNMQEQGHGQIFNMEGFGSDGRMMKKMSIYGTSKRALRYFTRSLAKEAADTCVQVGTISPGMVITDLILNSLDTTCPEDLERTKNIFNILGEKVETVAPFLVEGMLKSNKNNDRISYLSNSKVIWKFLKSRFSKNDFFAEK